MTPTNQPNPEPTNGNHTNDPRVVVSSFTYRSDIFELRTAYAKNLTTGVIEEEIDLVCAKDTPIPVIVEAAVFILKRDYEPGLVIADLSPPRHGLFM